MSAVIRREGHMTVVRASRFPRWGTSYQGQYVHAVRHLDVHFRRAVLVYGEQKKNGKWKPNVYGDEWFETTLLVRWECGNTHNNPIWDHKTRFPHRPMCHRCVTKMLDRLRRKLGVSEPPPEELRAVGLEVLESQRQERISELLKLRETM